MSIEQPEVWLKRAGVRFRVAGRELVMDCNECGKRGHLYVSRSTGLWNCKRCDARGNGEALQRSLGLLLRVSTAADHAPDHERDAADRLAKEIGRMMAASEPEKWAIALREDPRAEAAREYMVARGLDPEWLSRYQLVGWVDRPPPAGGDDDTGRPAGESSRRVLGRRPMQPAEATSAPAPAHPGWIALPALDEWHPDGTANPASVRMIKLRHAGSPKGFARVPGGTSSLYRVGPKPLDPGQRVVVCGAEIDALSLAAGGITNVVASTLGESSWSDAWTQQLEACEDIVIAFDDDEAGKAGAKALALRLGAHRCRIARPWSEYDKACAGAKDHNEALQRARAAGIPWDVYRLDAWLAAATPAAGEALHRFISLRQRYLDRHDPDAMRGDATPWPDLTRMLVGTRDGEVTVITGTEGSGKSTLASQWILHEAQAGRNALVLPLELGLDRQMDNFVQMLGGDLPANLGRDRIEGVFQRFAGLPLWIVDHYGSIDVEPVRNTLVLARRRYGVRRVLFDHLHFSVDDDDKARALIGRFTKMFAQVAMGEGMHIFVVAHANKGAQGQGNNRDDVIVQSNDLKGSSAIKQDADNILSVYRPRKRDRVAGTNERRYLPGCHPAMITLLKARAKGTTEGRAPLVYMEKEGRYEGDSPLFLSRPDGAPGRGTPHRLPYGEDFDM
jgi:ribosomal protein L37AE/L43A